MLSGYPAPPLEPFQSSFPDLFRFPTLAAGSLPGAEPALDAQRTGRAGREVAAHKEPHGLLAQEGPDVHPHDGVTRGAGDREPDGPVREEIADVPEKGHR